jgi:anti-anti-sigma factor
LPHFPPKPFRCAVAERDGSVHLRCAGELDMASAPVLEDGLRHALERGARRLVVDLRDLEFMDSSGLTVLARWSLGARDDRYALALVPGPRPVQRLFEITGMAQHFTFEEE